MGDIPLHSVVALLEEVPAQHFETGRALLLQRGQIGTVVTLYDGVTVEVEFAGRDGRTYVQLPIPENKLMVLDDAAR